MFLQSAGGVPFDPGELLVEPPALLGVGLGQPLKLACSSGRDRASMANLASLAWNSLTGMVGALLSSRRGCRPSRMSRGSYR